jgi:hypothetical protein
MLCEELFAFRRMTKGLYAARPRRRERTSDIAGARAFLDALS